MPFNIALVKNLEEFVLEIILILVCFIIYKAASYAKGGRKQNGRREYNPSYKSTPPTESSEDFTASGSDYSDSYERKYLFSRNEKFEFYKLLKWSRENNYYLFPKVRLLDIIEPRSGQDHYKSLLWKIQAKHIDFVICDKNLRVKFLIELDDTSHDRKDRSERDEFVRQALRGAGYELLHTRGISDAFLDELKRSI